MVIMWELNAMNVAGDGYELCRWREAEEYVGHLANVMCSPSDNWMPVPEDFDKPFGAQGHTFYYRRKKQGVE